MVLYLLGTIALFGDIAFAVGAGFHARFADLFTYLISGFAAWWILAGIAVRIGVGPRIFFAGLAAILEREPPDTAGSTFLVADLGVWKWRQRFTSVA